MTLDELVKLAFQAQSKAIAPYSQFPVGAALLTESGQVIAGANIESSSYGLSMCAERVALFKALSEGITEFTAIAIATRSAGLCPPCGACRQLLWEYAPKIQVAVANQHHSYKVYQLIDLFPEPFDRHFLSSHA